MRATLILAMQFTRALPASGRGHIRIAGHGKPFAGFAAEVFQRESERERERETGTERQRDRAGEATQRKRERNAEKKAGRKKGGKNKGN